MIKEQFDLHKVIPSDINEHLETLKQISEDCDHITELGTRLMVSTWAFLEGLKGREGKLVSIDIKSPLEHIKELTKLEGVSFDFVLGDSTQITIESTDFLFIDTIHTAEHLSKELAKHAGQVKKYIGFHDIESCKQELIPVITQFLNEHPEWEVFYFSRFNNGLMIIKRK